MTATDEVSDLELVSRFRRGDESAFATLVDRHGARLFRFLVGWLRNPDLAEEIAQAALVKAAVRIEQLAEGQAFLSWLFTIARTTGLDHLRRNPSERRVPLDQAPEPTDPGSDRAIVRDVRRVLDELDEQDREALLLADYLEMPMAEVAETLALKLSAAKMRVSRARQRFRDLWDKEAA